MTDGRLRSLEQAFRASGDPVDLGRWLVEAQRCGLEVDLAPLELAADCGSEAAAFTLGSDRIPGHVVCFRSLCRALRSCKGRIGKRARGELTVHLLEGLEPTDPAQAERYEIVFGELRAWSRDPRDGMQRRVRCYRVLRDVERSERPGWALVERVLYNAMNVMTTSNRGSAEALEDCLNLVASGWVVGFRRDFRETREQRMATLDLAQRRLEAWAFSQVAASLGATPEPARRSVGAPS